MNTPKSNNLRTALESAATFLDHTYSDGNGRECYPMGLDMSPESDGWRMLLDAREAIRQALANPGAHILITPKTCNCGGCDDRCPVCFGGLSICSVCKKAEQELLDSPTYATPDAGRVAYVPLAKGEVIQKGDMTIGEEGTLFHETDMIGEPYDATMYVHFRPITIPAPVPGDERAGLLGDALEPLPPPPVAEAQENGGAK